MAPDPTPPGARRGARARFGAEPAGYDEALYGRGDHAPLREVVLDAPPPPPPAGLVRPAADPVTAPQAFLDEAAAAAAARAEDAGAARGAGRSIADRESAYHRGRLRRPLSPERGSLAEQGGGAAEEKPPVKRRRRRWDLGPEEASAEAAAAAAGAASTLAAPAVAVAASEVGTPVTASLASAAAAEDARAMPPPPPPPPRRPPASGGRSRWDAEEPGAAAVAGATARARASRWDETPAVAPGGAGDGKRSRWDETPVMKAAAGVASGAVTPAMVASGLVAPELLQASRAQAEVDERNREWTDAELDALLPATGFTVLEPPKGYVPVRTPARKLLATPAPLATPLYAIPSEAGGMQKEDLGIPAELPDALKGIEMKAEDYTNFARVLDRRTKDEDLSAAELRERRIMLLLLKIKNGTPAMRKVALRQVTDRAREFGAGPLFNQILPLLRSPTLEDQERHLYVKVIDRVLYKLEDMVRPFVHKILVVIQPMLIDEDYYARAEGREIISNLSKAAGLGTMIKTMRPDVDNADEYVRNTTARAFAVVAQALGIPSLLSFLRAVCRSQKSWQARHTGIKIVQQIGILMGFGVLPHLEALVEIVAPGLTDEQQKVRTVTALALAALAEASTPFGIESFEIVLKPLWEGILQHRGRVLAAFLKAIGCVLPLMDTEYASYYANRVNKILIREFQSPDENMRMIVLKVVKQCVGCEGVSPQYVRTDIVPEYFRSFWVRRMALDRRNYQLVVDTTLEIAVKVGGTDIVARLVEGLKDESEPFRRMVIDAVGKIAVTLGLSDIDTKLEERLVDGMSWAFQEHGGGSSNDSPVVLNALACVMEKLGMRAQPYLKQMVSMVQWRLNNRNAQVREYAADLIAKTAAVMHLCNEEELMGHLSAVLFEYLGEEFPDVLGSILCALKAIVDVIGLESMKPPVQDLLPRLTPILKNRHEKVQENCILLVGRIADRGARFVSPREWMRICFELLELLKAPRKAIRKSAVSTFGYIAKAIGPNDILGTLLNNLKVQERTQRVCTTVAIAIVAEKCMPYTVVPALMHEYRIPEMNVQNGVLKSFSFLFEHIGEMSKDYVYAVVPVLEDALVDRDLVHRQTACSAVAHLALGVRGHGLEDALVHLLNHVWPNIFETSPHVVNSVLSAIEGCMVALGPGPILLYVLSGLFHPARAVRDAYWRVYNRLYVYAQDGLVAYAPRIPNVAADVDSTGIVAGSLEDDDKYVRHELLLLA